MQHVNRRTLLKGASLGVVAAVLPRLAFATPAIDKRLVVVIQRGGMDGLAAVPAYGDPAFDSARAGIATPPPGSADGAIALDSTFGLHPALTEFATLYSEKALLPIHAACVAYHGRSHFEAQNVLENGSAIPYLLKSGWLNRSLSALPAAEHDVGIAIAQTMPVIMRGDAAVTSWYPSVLPQPNTDTIARIAAMYATDAKLDAALARARSAHEMATDTDPGSQFASLMAAAGSFLVKPDGPRIAMIESSGWDTHAAQAANYGALARNLRELNRGVASLRSRARFGVESDRRIDHDGVRPHGGHERHSRHRPRHRWRGVPAGWCGGGRSRARRLARTEAQRSARGARPETDDRSARR